MSVETICARKNYGRNTQSANTKIVQLIEPFPGCWTRITGIRVTTGTTAHILTVLRPLNMTTVASAAAASQAVINITAAPGTYTAQGTVATANNTMAGSDWVVYQCADGTFVVDLVSSVATLAITMTTNVPTSTVAAGAPFWFYGIETDTNPNDNAAHPRYNLLASTENILGRADGISTILDNKFLDVGDGIYQPLVIVIDNATAASTLQSVGVEYIQGNKKGVRV